MNRIIMFALLLPAILLSAHAGSQRPFISDAYTGLLLHLDETSPGTVYDVSGHANTGFESGTSIVAGRFGYARHFDGASSAITVADPSDGSLDFSATQSFTLEVWFRTTTSATQTLVRKGLAPVPGYLLQMIGGKVVGNVGSYNENIYVFQSDDRYDDGQWHHAALVVDRKLKNIALYVDDKLAAAPVQDSSPFSVANDRPLTIGRWENSSWPYYFAGDIDEIRVSPIARYAPCDTVACWRLDEASGSMVADASPYHDDGTAYSTTVVAGETGNARHFDTGSYVYVSNPNNGILGFSATESFTVEASFKTTYAYTQEIVRRGLAPTPGYLIQMIDGKVVGNVGSYDTNIHVFQSTNSYNDGQWHHAVLVTDRDQAKIFLYVDGVLTTTPVDDTEPFAVHNDRCLTIGRWENNDWPYYFHGSIDNVVILKGAHHPAGTPTPHITVIPDSLGFGTVQVGSVGILPLTIYNSSTQQALSVQLQSTSSLYSSSSPSLEIAPGETKVISVRYSPTLAQHDTGSLLLSTNDPQNPIKRVILTGTGTGTGGSTNYGSLVVYVFNAENWGQPGSLARVVLYTSAGVPWMETRANASSVARFDSVPSGEGYWYKVFVAKPTPWGEVFAGEKTGITVKTNQTTEEAFIHNTPYCPAVSVYNDFTNELLPDSGFKAILPGTRLRIELAMKNPTYSGARTVTGFGKLRLDRDRAEPYDTTLTSSLKNLSPGDSTTLVFYCIPRNEGAYFLTVSAFASSDHYATTLTDADNWHDPAFTVLPELTIVPPWTYINTGTTHTVIIPTTANTGVNGLPLGNGDYVGVFYDSLGSLKCAGFERWTGTGNIAVTVFGDDPTTAAKDGFENGEVFRWKIFRALTGEVITVDVTYSSPGGIVTHTNAFASNGISRLASFTEGNVTRRLSLRSGWSLISSTVAPYVTTLDTIFNSIRENLIILKNGSQKSYIPSVPVNTIGVWNSSEGYQIKMASADTLFFIGRKILPQTESYAIPTGWSIMPYLKDSSMAIATLLGGVSSYVVIVKDQDGKTYIPSAGINTIANLEAGQAYLIKMTSARTLNYPAEALRTEPAVEMNKPIGIKKSATDAPSWYYTNTGESHTVIIPVSSAPSAGGSPLAAGCYIGAFYDSSGTLACAGYEMWTGNTNIAVAVFGDDPTTPAKDGLAAGEVIQWKIWRPTQGTTGIAKPSYLAPGSLSGVVTDTGTYHANGISAMSALVGSLTGVASDERPSVFILEQNYPNPFNPTTVISCQLPVASMVRLVVYDMLGREVAVLMNGELPAGEHRFTFDATGLAS